MYLFKQLKSILTRRKLGRDVVEFQRDIDFVVEYFEIDPELPEIIGFRADAAKTLMSNDSPRLRMQLLRMLNPNEDVSGHHTNTIILYERIFGHVLQIWSVARHHVPRLDEYLIEIIVDETGTHLVDQWGTRFTALAGAINPRRLADPGNRYEIACAIIAEFTGIKLDYVELVGNTKTITVTKSENGWAVALDKIGINS